MRSITFAGAVSGILALCCVSTAWAQEKTTSDDAIKAAIALLEGKKTIAAGEADEERIRMALDGLKKLLNDKAGAVPPGAPAFRITPQSLKKLNARFATVDAKTGELTLTYDFTNKDQLKDFETNGDKITQIRGGIQLDAGQSITHVVRYKTLTLSGTVAASNIPGEYLKTSGGIRLGYRGLVGSHTRAFLVVGEKPTDTTQLLSDSLINKALELKLTVMAKRASLRLGGQEIGLAVDTGDVGQITLCAPSGKTVYGKLILVGTVDPKWAGTFFGK